MKYKYIHWVEENGRHFLTIGKSAPWLNIFWIRVPLFVAKLF